VILSCASTAVPLPWKNGGGVTRELLRRPAAGADPGVDDWTLRISVADIDADGPFSPFPGVTRWFAVLTGAGLRLRWPTHAQHVHAGEAPLRFDGADAPDCTLFDGPTRDLNVMVRATRADALVTAAAWHDEAEPGASPGFGFFALRALVLHGAGDLPVRMEALSLAWCDTEFRASRAWSLKPEHAADRAGAQALPGYWIRLTPPRR
jgi:uncharacterized protein